MTKGLKQESRILAEMKWCVILPTFNNATTLEGVIRSILNITANLIVVNDGSTDATRTVLQNFPDVEVVTYSANRGKGFALRKGFSRAVEMGFTHAVTLDSDGQHLAEDITRFVEKAHDHPDAIILGSRRLPKQKMNKGSRFANRFSNFWFRLISGVELPDTQSGFRWYPVKLLQNIRFFTRRYEFELEVLIRSAWKGIPLLSIPIRVYYPDKSGRISHFRPFTDFVRISLLNAVCAFIALAYVKPFSFLQYIKRESIKGFFRKQILQTGDSISKITLSVMLGIFMGIVPIWGYQLITAITLAYILKLNRLIVIVAANISIPPMIPLILYLSYLTGGYVLSVNSELAFRSDINLVWVRDNLFQYVVGSIVFAFIAALCFGLVTLIMLHIFRKNQVQKQ
jgi:glycosyltransferase involved in cell wall biosynthesis